MPSLTPAVKHLPSTKATPPHKLLPCKPQPSGCSIVRDTAAKGKSKRKSSQGDPNSSTLIPVKKAQSLTTIFSFAAKVVGVHGLILYDDTNSLGYDSNRCDQLRERLLLAMRTLSLAQGVLILGRCVPNSKKDHRASFNKCCFWPPDQTRNSARLWNNVNNLNIVTCVYFSVCSTFSWRRESFLAGERWWGSRSKGKGPPGLLLLRTDSCVCLIRMRKCSKS